MSIKQQTIANPIAVEGYGLHTGESAIATLRPAPDNSGIRFRRIDLPGEPEIEATVDSVSRDSWETALGNEAAEIRTVEHVLAAVHALRVDNLNIDLSGPEPPALDGSARTWCTRLLESGLVEQTAEPRVLKVKDPIHIQTENARYSVLPHNQYRISGHIEFDHPLIGHQFASVQIDPDAFTEEVAGARTFGFETWKQTLNEQGFALGASHANTVVLTDDGLAADSHLRYPDEFIRHKILDIAGDLALVGARLQCHVIAERPGHRGNVEVAKQLKSQLTGESGQGLDIQEIMKILPHRYPMLLVDRVIDFEEEKRIVGIKNVTANEPFFTGHFPDHPIMPGVLIVEALAQCGGLLLMKGIANPEDVIVYFLSVDDVKFRKPVVPGDQLTLELEMIQFRSRRGKMKGVAKVDGEVVTEATILGQVMDR